MNAIVSEEKSVTDEMEIARQRRARAVAAEFAYGGEVAADAVAVEALAGMTNRNYLASALGKRFVVRIPGEGTEEYIDRKADEEAGRLTSDIGVNAPVVYYDPNTGTQITRFIEGCVTMSAKVFQDAGAVRRAAVSFHKLHTCGRKLKNDFNEKAVAQDYLDVLKGRNARLPEGYEKVQKQADAIREVLRATAAETVPCHNDPAPENLVDTGERVYILDWEFAGNNDPFWDLADLSVETGFTEEQDRVLLEAYLGRPLRQSEYGRIVLYKSLAFLLWTLWGVLQHVNDNPRPAYHFASYWDYAMDRFTKCQAIMNSDRFADLDEAVRIRA